MINLIIRRLKAKCTVNRYKSKQFKHSNGKHHETPSNDYWNLPLDEQRKRWWNGETPPPQCPQFGKHFEGLDTPQLLKLSQAFRERRHF